MVLAAPCSFLRHILDLLEESCGWGRVRPSLECLPGISFCFSLRDSPASFSSWQASYSSQAMGLGDCSSQRRWPQGACGPVQAEWSHSCVWRTCWTQSALVPSPHFPPPPSLIIGTGAPYGLRWLGAGVGLTPGCRCLCTLTLNVGRS